MERNVPFSQGVDFFFRHHCQIGLKPPEDVYSCQNINTSMQLSHTDTQQQGTNLDRWAFCAQSTSLARCGQHWSLAPELVCEICLWRERRQYRWAHPQPADAHPSLRHPEEQLHQCTPKERWHGYRSHNFPLWHYGDESKHVNTHWLIWSFSTQHSEPKSSVLVPPDKHVQFFSVGGWKPPPPSKISCQL